VSKPRLRTRGRPGREVPIPLYEQLQGDSGLAARMSEILVSGVSTRKYARVLPAMAASAGISRSSVSRAVKGTRKLASGSSWSARSMSTTFWPYTSTASKWRASCGGCGGAG
jgi:hypothetical protein